MVRRSTWILLLLFAILVGFAFFFQRYQTNKDDNAATATPTMAPQMVYNLGGAQVDDIKLSDSAGNSIDIYRDEEGSKWAIPDIPTDQVDSAKIDSASEQLFSLQVQETITQSLPLDSIGLASPAYNITMKLSDGTQLITEVGSPTPIGSGYYVRVNSGQLIIVDKLVMDDILQLLTEPPLLPTPTLEVTPVDTVLPTETGNQATPTP
jgi:hypothetical protein